LGLVWCEAAQQRVNPPPPLAVGGVLAGLAAEGVCGGEERSGDLRPQPSRAWRVCACGKNLGKLVVLGGPCQLGAGGEPPAWCWWPGRPWGPRTGCPRTGGPECGGCYRLYPTCELVSGLVESWVGLSATAAAAAAAAARLATWLLLLAMETWNISIFSGRSPGRRTLRSPSTGGRRARAEDSTPRLERGGAAGLAESRGIGNRIGDSQEAAAGAAIVMVHGDRMEGSSVDRIGDGEAHHARSVMHRRRPGPLHIEAAGAGRLEPQSRHSSPEHEIDSGPARTSAPRVAGQPGRHTHDSLRDAAGGPRVARRAKTPPPP
jgi:hypothetical protein